jgi:hypothetical protein
VQVMLDGRVAAFRRRGVTLPPPVVVADSWLSDSKFMRHVATTHQGTVLVEGKTTYVFALPDKRQVKGHDLQRHRDWPWRSREQVPGVRYARLRATSSTYGAVTLIVIAEPGEEQCYVMCLDTAISGPRLIRAGKRRHWSEHCFRTLKHLLATSACQVHSEDAYYGHLVLRLMGCLVLFYTSRSCTAILRIIHSAPQPATMPSFHHHLRGHCHGTDPLVLPTRARGSGVRLPDALLAMAQRRRCLSPADRTIQGTTTQALQCTQTLCRPHPEAPLCPV